MSARTSGSWRAHILAVGRLLRAGRRRGVGLLGERRPLRGPGRGRLLRRVTRVALALCPLYRLLGRPGVRGLALGPLQLGQQAWGRDAVRLQAQRLLRLLDRRGRPRAQLAVQLQRLARPILEAEPVQLGLQTVDATVPALLAVPGTGPAVVGQPLTG